jgi:hypothetical protein
VEQLVVRNATDEEIVVLFDGHNIVFKAGQRKVYTPGVARGIVFESKDKLTLEESPELAELPEVTIQPQIEVVLPESGSKNGDYSESTTSDGRTQYRKKGILISKKEWEKA